MKNSYQLPEKLPDDIINRARKLSSSLIADAMKGDNTMTYEIQPVSENMRFVGTAVTVSMEPGDNLFLHQAIYNGEEGYVLAANGKSFTNNAYLGELMAAAAQAIGLEAIVIDGLVRDKMELKKLGFPIFAKGFTPAGPLKEGPGNYNRNIYCGGVHVTPGDLIVGDEDGVVVAPKENVESILSRAEDKQNYEKSRLEIISKYRQNKAAGKKIGSLEPEWLKDKIAIFKREERVD